MEEKQKKKQYKVNAKSKKIIIKDKLSISTFIVNEIMKKMIEKLKKKIEKVKNNE